MGVGTCAGQVGLIPATATRQALDTVFAAHVTHCTRCTPEMAAPHDTVPFSWPQLRGTTHLHWRWSWGSWRLLVLALGMPGVLGGSGGKNA